MDITQLRHPSEAAALAPAIIRGILAGQIGTERERVALWKIVNRNLRSKPKPSITKKLFAKLSNNVNIPNFLTPPNP